jgi:hypothetical protein
MTRREGLFHFEVHVLRQADLFQVVGALHFPRCFSGSLNGR